MADSAVAFLVGAYIIFPLLGLVWLGIRNERLQQRRMLSDSVRTLHRLSIVRNRRL